MKQLIENEIPCTMENQSVSLSLHVTETREDHAFIVASVKSSGDTRRIASTSYTQIAKTLSERGMAVIHERIFGSLSVADDVICARKQAFISFGISPENPVTYVEGRPPWGEGFAGVLIQACSADKVWTIRDRDVACGRGWRRNGFTHLVLQNITGKCSGLENSENRPAQVRMMLDRAERVLRENGVSYRNVMRTWFYLPDILDWYAAFNKARNEKYGEFGIMPGPGDKELLLPASTGIKGETLSGAATMDLIAIAGETGARPVVKQLTNTAQLDAFRYGSAFSRGAVIQEGEVSLIEISGTASIDQHGKSQFVGDIHGQINCTFEKIERLIAREGAGLEDIAAATVYVKRPEYAEMFWEAARKRGLEEFPAVCIVADVCRDELLFEIDAEAAIVGSERKRFHA